MFLCEGWIRLSHSSGLCSAGQKKRSQNKENICFLKAASGLRMWGEREKASDFKQTVKEVIGDVWEHTFSSAGKVPIRMWCTQNQTSNMLGFFSPFFLLFSFFGTCCVGCFRNHFPFLQPPRMAAGLGAWLWNTTFLKSLKGSPRRNGNRGVQAEASSRDRGVGGGRR